MIEIRPSSDDARRAEVFVDGIRLQAGDIAIKVRGDEHFGFSLFGDDAINSIVNQRFSDIPSIVKRILLQQIKKIPSATG